MRRSLDGRQVAWRVLGRCCRPTVDKFITLVLFSVGGTLLMVLWTFEPRSVDQRAAEEEVQRQLVENFLHEKDRLRKELDRLSNASNNDFHPWEGQLDDRPGTIKSAKRRPHFDIDSDTADNNKPPEMVLQNTGRTRTPPARVVPLSVSRLVAVQSGRDAGDSNRTLLVDSNNDRFLQRVRLKLLSDVTPSRALRRQGRRSNNSRPTFGDGRNDSLVASQRWCSVYNTTPEVDESFSCIRLLMKPPTTVCLYPDAQDVHVSRHLRDDGLWEPHIVRLFQNLLFQNPDLGVIDIGSHIGQYSLIAASMGRRVVAVEPYPPSLRRLHKAIKINDVEKQVRETTNIITESLVCAPFRQKLTKR